MGNGIFLLIKFTIFTSLIENNFCQFSMWWKRGGRTLVRFLQTFLPSSPSLYLTLLYLQPLYLILLDLQPIYHTSPTLPHFLIFASLYFIFNHSNSLTLLDLLCIYLLAKPYSHGFTNAI